MGGRREGRVKIQQESPNPAVWGQKRPGPARFVLACFGWLQLMNPGRSR